MEKQAIVVSALIFKNNKLLIAKRAKTKSFLPGIWELPGGHVEFGETAEDALIRELKEELQINIQVKNPVYVFTYISNNGLEHIVEIDYLAKMTNPRQKIKLNEIDHSDYKWIQEKEIDHYFSSNDDERKAVVKGFAMQKPN